uniref:Uncharacterized protein n=1 Tax=Caenorhabditis tropicalis TaxID=1561998 RepID=A0A1I7U4M2_9PELO
MTKFQPQCLLTRATKATVTATTTEEEVTGDTVVEEDVAEEATAEGTEALEDTHRIVGVLEITETRTLLYTTKSAPVPILIENTTTVGTKSGMITTETPTVSRLINTTKSALVSILIENTTTVGTKSGMITRGEIIRHMKFDPDRPVSPIEIGDDVREAIRNDAIERNRRLEGGIQEGRINEGRNRGTEMTVVRGRGRNARVIARLRLEQRIPQRTLVERLQLPNNRNWMAGIDLNSSHNDPPQFQDDFVTKREPFSRRICKKEYVGTRLWNPCLFCDGPHKADECCNIVHVRDRKEFINRASRCLRCFQRHHIDNCPHLERDCCKYCHDTSGDLHHPALCDKPKTIFL